jgi:hypothetical protein
MSESRARREGAEDALVEALAELRSCDYIGRQEVQAAVNAAGIVMYPVNITHRIKFVTSVINRVGPLAERKW